jgi:hypothetical protein
MPVSFDDIPAAQKAVIDAVRELIRRDADLFHRDVSERSICHWLATYLARPSRFGRPDDDRATGYDVDCEYNRNGQFAKSYGEDLPPSLMALLREHSTRKDVESVAAYPDIIVHHRDTNARNFVMIEAKKTTGVGQDLDRLKLNAFGRGQYKYKVRASLLFETWRDFSSRDKKMVVRSYGPAAVLRFLEEDSDDGDGDVESRVVYVGADAKDIHGDAALAAAAKLRG